MSETATIGVRFIPDTVQMYSEGDKDFEKELIDSYKQSVEEHLPQLAVSLEKGDVGNSTLHSHDIKGSSSYVGAEAVRLVSEKMEALCKQSNLKDAAVHLPDLQKEIKIVFKLLDKYVAEEEWDENATVEEVEKELAAENKDEKKDEEKKEEKKEEEKKEENNTPNKDNKEDSKEDNKVKDSTTKVTDTKKQDKD